MKYMISFGSCVMALAIASGAHASAPTYKELAKALASNPGCVHFTWEGGDRGEGAIIVPAQINDHAIRMQLDTGSETSETYGQIAVQSGWAKAGEKFYFPARFTVANDVIASPRVMANTEMKANPVGGTIGLDQLLGFTVVIDYPSSRVCLFTAKTAPAMLDNVAGVHGTISQGRFLLPLMAQTFQSQRMMFDTGTSRMDLVLGESSWQAITGRSSTENGRYQLKLPSWGKTITFVGADTRGRVSLGELSFSKAIAFTMTGSAGRSYDPSYDGVIGNQLFTNGVVVLDLSTQAWFGFLAK
ncbi:hypothetical protein [Dyella sp. A6]|uniref:hypothetical protein n=1 Tax=Dyella aluminiiresistens TaxID=3069105 RepID=UPI002E79C38E|nr:hypothetical protein [Dyella sp. A6]